KALNMVKNIISIGKNFEMKVLAEGVETLQQLNELKACGCDLIQGYFYSKPLSLEDLIAFTKQNQSKETVVE
ncbi:EAL domain-containing protein, partial [Vibrio diabolicus]|nr:EAL domain-containing protein [Vibrio diabolicus]